MKNKLIIILIMSCLFTVSMAQEYKWDYPTKPGSNEWTKLTTQEMKVKACQIPSEILHQISTTDLVDLYLNYPLLLNINVFSTFQKGMDNLRSNFNGVDELILRRGSAKLLMEKYINISPKKIDSILSPMESFKYALDLMALELLISQKEVLDYYTKNELNLILINSLQKYQDKKELIKFYDEIGISTVSFLISSLILKIDPEGTEFSLQEIKDLNAKANSNFPGFLNYLPELDRISNHVTRLIK